ncbi:MAG: anaerobic sulfatase maturase [Kiritimatiellia bacterium]|jgi:uncharacterized protein
MPPFSLLVKPASFDCNLRCRYCFYLPKKTIFGPGPHRMEASTLEALVSNYLACPMERHAFAWQGGEPTLMGLDFYREAVRLQKRYAPAAKIPANSLQTNGTLLDDAWGAFLRENRFLVGISLDGPAPLHDRFRLRSDGAGSHADVLRGLKVLRRQGVDFNALALVSTANQDRPEEVYAYLREQGVRFHQYIECVEFDGQGRRRPYALAPGKWGEFLCRLFDAWYPRDVHTVSIRLFDSILSRLVTRVPTMCSMAGDCRGYFVVEHDGSIYPCDFQVRQDLLLGNVRTDSFADVWASPRYRQWGKGKEARSPACAACRFRPLCMGDCPKNRREHRSVLCEDWMLFYSHTIERFERLASALAETGARPEGKRSPSGLLPD